MIEAIEVQSNNTNVSPSVNVPLESFSVWLGILIALGGIAISSAITLVSWTTAVNNFRKNQEIKELTLMSKIHELAKERLELEKNLQEEIETLTFEQGNLKARIGEIEYWLTRTQSGFVPANVRGSSRRSHHSYSETKKPKNQE